MTVIGVLLAIILFIAWVRAGIALLDRPMFLWWVFGTLVLLYLVHQP
jgi:hypothetical protein